jgi:hypothetical protein
LAHILSPFLHLKLIHLHLGVEPFVDLRERAQVGHFVATIVEPLHRRFDRLALFFVACVGRDLDFIELGIRRGGIDGEESLRTIIAKREFPSICR